MPQDIPIPQDPTASHPIFQHDPEFNWTIGVPLPNHNDWQELSLLVRFRLIAADELDSLLGAPSRDLFDRIVVCILDLQGQPIEKAVQNRLLGYFPIQKAIIVSYQAAIIGQHAKN